MTDTVNQPPATSSCEAFAEPKSSMLECDNGKFPPLSHGSSSPSEPFVSCESIGDGDVPHISDDSFSRSPSPETLEEISSVLKRLSTGMEGNELCADCSAECELVILAVYWLNSNCTDNTKKTPAWKTLNRKRYSFWQ